MMLYEILFGSPVPPSHLRATGFVVMVVFDALAIVAAGTIALGLVSWALDRLRK